MSTYKYKIKVEDLKDLLPLKGYGIVSDKITVEGEKVGFMYREKPEEKEDTGWRFISGTESQEYIDDDANSMFFELNVIANYDEAIIPYLKAKIGSEFERIEDSDEFREI